jgi:prefoldin subunit 5
MPGVPSESQALKGQAELLQSQLDLVNQRINELEAKTNK